MNNETEQIFIVNTSNTQPLVGVPKIDEASVSTADVEDFSTVCRTCATVTEFVIPIFDGEGLQNNLADKIHKHLPIQVSEQDVLPRVVCYQCASTLLAWHELVQCCLQADEALRARVSANAVPPEIHPSDTTKSKTIDKDTIQISVQQKDDGLPGTAETEIKARETPTEGRSGSASSPPREDAKPTAILLAEDGRRYSKCGICQKNVPANSWKRHARYHRGEKRYSCHACGLGFGDSGNLARHTRAIHARQRPHECPVCHKAFSRKSHLQDHVRSHSESRDFVCDVCGKASKSSAALRMHRVTHDACRFQCMECGSKFKRQSELRAHVTVHTGERAHACPCGRSFRLRSQLTAHARTHTIKFKEIEDLVRSLEPPRYTPPATRACAYCRARVPDHAYKEHLVALHSSCLFHCDECDTYVDRKEFILHMSTHAVEYAAKQEKKKPAMRAKILLKNKTERKDENENDERRKCNKRTTKIDNRENDERSQVDVETTTVPRYVEKNEFSDHSDTENGFGPLPESVFEAIEDSQDGRPPESIAPSVDGLTTESRPKEPGEVQITVKPKKCPKCEREFAARSSYFYHMKHFHGQSREHECVICGKRFGTRATLAEHEHIHSGARPYACDQCGKQFGSRASLYIHLQTHGSVKRWACPQCPRAFRWRTQLARHASRHAAKRDHECGQCDRSFNVHADLLRHARTHQKQDHVCEQCGLHFAQLRYLKVHMRKKHANEKESGAAKQNSA